MYASVVERERLWILVSETQVQLRIFIPSFNTGTLLWESSVLMGILVVIDRQI